jgi:bifunctional non-homologous end joining protein LigD
LLRGRADGFCVAPFEQGEIGPALFEVACRMRLEGIVSKHRGRSYRVGVRVLAQGNRKHPAFNRVAEQHR